MKKEIEGFKNKIKNINNKITAINEELNKRIDELNNKIYLFYLKKDVVNIKENIGIIINFINF